MSKLSIGRAPGGSGALALGLLCIASVVGAQSTDQDIQHAAEQFKAEIHDVNSGLKDPRTQRTTDVSRVLANYIPLGTALRNAEAFLRSAGCKDVFSTGGCKMAVSTNGDKSRSLRAMFQLPGHFLEGHSLMIEAQATADQDPTISALRATIDIRTVSPL